MADPFNAKIIITSLGMSTEIEKVDTKEFDKSMRIAIELQP